jgi:hypothetical protein
MHRWDTVRSFSYQWLFPGILGAIFLLVYWSYSPSLITVGIVQLGLGVLLDVTVAPVQQLVTDGAALPTDTVGRAVDWLLTPTGLYAAGLASPLFLAGSELLDNLRAYRRGFPLAVTGLGLSVLLLPLPIAIPQIERLKFAVTLVAIFPVAIGLNRLLSVDRRYVAMAVIIVATMGVATAFTVLTADDLPGVYIDEPGEQVSMSENQFRAVGSTASFLQRYGTGSAATDTLTARAMEVSQFNATRPLNARPGGLRTRATNLIVRARWTDHLVALGRGLLVGEQNTFAVSPARFTATDATRTKVYTSGDTHVYHSPDGFRGLYGANATAG